MRRVPGWASGSGGYRPACSSAWPAPSSRQPPGTPPRSPARPVSFYYAGYANAAGTHPCPATGCPPGPSWSREVLPLGNPAIWWVSIPAVLFCLGWWLTRRDWRAGASLLGIIAGWLPWFLFLKRTPQFDYYSLEFL